MITGSTDGIGKQYARELASRGINVVLISRTKKKLVEVANEIEQEFHVKTKWIAADFSQGRDIYPRIEEELRGIPVGILGKLLIIFLFNFCASHIFHLKDTHKVVQKWRYL